VEVQVSFVVTPVKQGKRKMRAVLRSIALINGKFTLVCTDHAQMTGTHMSTTQDANKKRLQAEAQPQLKPTPLQLKRKIGYNTDSEPRSDEQNKKNEVDLDHMDIVPNQKN
jgi:hypothetical protein